MANLFFILCVLLFSIYLLILRGTMPRYRIDRAMGSTWKEWNFALIHFLTISISLYFIYMY